MRKLTGPRALVAGCALGAMMVTAAACGSDSPAASDDDPGSGAATTAFVLDVDDPGRTDDAAAVVERRLRALGIEDARVAVDGSQIQVEYDGAEADLVRLALAGPGQLEFRPVLALEGQQIPDGELTAADDLSPEREATLRSEDGSAYRLGPVGLGGSAVEAASASQEPGGSWSVNPVLREGDDGIDGFNELASACYDAAPDVCPGLSQPGVEGVQRGMVAVVFDGVVLSAPSINAPSFERDQIQISGSWDRNEATAVAAAIEAGSSPVTWTVRG